MVTLGGCLDNEKNQSKEAEDFEEPGKTGKDLIGGAVCIFYTSSPFSDFHPSPFLTEGKFFHSVEHFFQIQMLYSFGMFRLASKLIQIQDAISFRKSLRQNLKAMIKSDLFDDKMFASWRKKNAAHMMRKGNKAKFEQNFTLREQLIATGERILIFAHKNDFLLGVGMTERELVDWMQKKQLHIQDLLDYFSGVRSRPKELGANQLGVALMELRAEITGKVSILKEWRAQHPKVPEAEEKEEAPDSSENVPPETPPAPQDNGGLVQEEKETREVIILSEERRIVYRKLDSVPKVVGGDVEAWRLRKQQLADSRARKTPLPQPPSPGPCAPVDSLSRNQGVLERLKNLSFETPLINPFSFGEKVLKSGSASVSAIASQEPEEPEEEPVRIIPKKKTKPTRRLWGPTYVLEPGEVPPPGLHSVLPEQNPPPYAVIRPPLRPEAFGKPAALPPHLWHWVPPPPLQLDRPRPLFCPPLIPLAPPEGDGDKDSVWKPPKEPLKQLMKASKTLDLSAVQKLPPAPQDSEEGLNPASASRLKRKRRREAEEVEAEEASYGLGATLQDLQEMGFVPPPIAAISGDPRAQARNKYRQKDDWGLSFSSREAALRHHANRWKKGGRLGITGEFEECSSDDDDDLLAYYPSSSDEDEETGKKKQKRSYETQVIFVDTTAYGDYVRWYQESRGINSAGDDLGLDSDYLRKWFNYYRSAIYPTLDPDPLLTSGSVGPEQLLSQTDFWHISRWRWAQWEKQVERGADKNRQLPQESWSDGVSCVAQPLLYSSNPDNQGQGSDQPTTD